MAPTTDNDLKQMDSFADEKPHEETREINTASAALAAAVAEQKPKLLSPSMLRLYMIMGIGYLVSTMNGFDSSLMGAINAMKPYQETFGLNGAGSTTGIIFIIYQIGQIASFPCKSYYKRSEKRFASCSSDLSIIQSAACSLMVGVVDGVSSSAA
jgi:hypothetical protein